MSSPRREVAFFIKDTKAAQANMQDAVDNLKMSLAHQTPRALVLFNCTSRDEKMMGAPLFDVRALKEAFTPNLPLVGIAGGGEFSTVGRQSHLFQYCSVIVALTEDHSDVE